MQDLTKGWGNPVAWSAAAIEPEAVLVGELWSLAPRKASLGRLAAGTRGHCWAGGTLPADSRSRVCWGLLLFMLS